MSPVSLVRKITPLACMRALVMSVCVLSGVVAPAVNVMRDCCAHMEAVRRGRIRIFCCVLATATKSAPSERSCDASRHIEHIARCCRAAFAAFAALAVVCRCLDIGRGKARGVVAASVSCSFFFFFFFFSSPVRQVKFRQVKYAVIHLLVRVDAGQRQVR
eukprot:671632-Rhodomonas_salina.1